MSDTLPAGTLAYLIGLAQMEVLNGHVVEVARRVPDYGDDEVYQVIADWTQYVWPGRDVHTDRRNLLPIVPPRPVATTRKVEHAK